MTTNRDTVTEWIEAQGETDATMLATAILDASHALAAIHEQVRIANLIALATIDPDKGGPSEDLTEISREALERLAIRRRHTSFGREGVPEEIVTWSLLPDIAAALGIPQEDQP